MHTENDVDIERLRGILGEFTEAATEEKMKVADNHDALMHENTQYSMMKRLEEILNEAKNLLGEFSLLHTLSEYWTSESRRPVEDAELNEEAYEQVSDNTGVYYVSEEEHSYNWDYT